MLRLGGGLISGLIKRSKMRDAGAEMEDARRELERFRRELEDVDQLIDPGFTNFDLSAFGDLFLDGFLFDLVAQGKSVIMISSEMPEILGMCDRIYVMNEGRIVAEMGVEEATQEKIMAAILKNDSSYTAEMDLSAPSQDQIMAKLNKSEKKQEGEETS